MKEKITRQIITEMALESCLRLTVRLELDSVDPSDTRAGVLALALIRDGSLELSNFEGLLVRSGIPPALIEETIKRIEHLSSNIEEIQHDIPTV